MSATPDDVPDFGWQELCDGGWIETNLSIRAETTSSVMGPWKGPSGRNLFCSTCRPGTYSAAGSTCRLCSAGTFSDSFNSIACINCSAPAGYYCPEQSCLAGLICPVGYSCPGDVQDKLRCPSATYVGWSYCPGGHHHSIQCFGRNLCRSLPKDTSADLWRATVQAV